MVEHGVNAVALINMGNPLPGDTGVNPDYIYTHIFQKGHFVVEGSHNDIVGLFPKAVVEIGSYGKIIPVHTIHDQWLTINN